MPTFYDQLKTKPNSYIPFEKTDLLVEFKKEYKDCTLCPLSKDRKGMVFGYGFLRPKIMFLGLKPTPYDVETGVPFSDIPSQKLQGMVRYMSRTINLDNSVYFSTMVLCAGETRQDEIDACQPRLLAEIKTVRPKHIILLGEETAKYFAPVERLQKLAVKLDQYYSVYLTRSLRELFYKADELRIEVKEDLDYIVEQIRNEEQPVKNGNQVIPR